MALEILNPYSNLKLLAHRQWLDELKHSGFAMPITLNIYPTNLCSDNCSYCFFRGDEDIGGVRYNLYDSRKRLEAISEDSLINLAYEIECINIKAVNITGGGEPTLAKGFGEFCEILLVADIDIGLTTNGHKLGDYMDLVKQFKYLRVSLDSFNPSTRVIIRGNYGLENIIDLLAEISASDCYVGLNFVITQHNFKEIYAFAVEAKEIGIKHINFVVPRTRMSYNIIYHGYKSEVVELVNGAEELQSPTFTIRFSGFYEDEKPTKKTFSHCWYNWTQLTILADGTCYPCCITATQGNENFGNINEYSLMYIISSDERRKFIREFNINQCKICWYSEKNRLMEYWMKEKRFHENFV